MVSAKNSKIFSRLFFRKIVLKIMLSYVLQRKEAFYDDKNVNFVKSEKNGYFPKEKYFPSKNPKFLLLSFFLKVDLEIMLSFGLKRNKALQNSKNFNFVKSKKCFFFKGVNASFRSKNPKFLLACFLVQ